MTGRAEAILLEKVGATDEAAGERGAPEQVRRSARDVLRESRLLRQRAAILDHLAGVVNSSFIPALAQEPSPLLIKFSDTGPVPPDLNVIAVLMTELERGANDARARAARLLGATIALDQGPPGEGLCGGPALERQEASDDDGAGVDMVIENPELRRRTRGAP